MQEDIKYVTREDFEDFFNQEFPYKEIYFNENRTVFKINFWLDQAE